jgi:hypothetical protein
MRSDGDYSIALQINRLRTEHTLVESTLFPHHFNEITLNQHGTRPVRSLRVQVVFDS